MSSTDNTDKAFPAHENLREWYYQRGSDIALKYDRSFLIEEFTQLKKLAGDMAEALDNIANNPPGSSWRLIGIAKDALAAYQAVMGTNQQIGE